MRKIVEDDLHFSVKHETFWYWSSLSIIFSRGYLCLSFFLIYMQCVLIFDCFNLHFQQYIYVIIKYGVLYYCQKFFSPYFEVKFSIPKFQLIGE